MLDIHFCFHVFLLGGDKERYSKEYVFNPQKFRYQSRAPGPGEALPNLPRKHNPDNSYIRAYRSPIYSTNPEQKYSFSEPQTPKYNHPNEYPSHPYSQSYTELTKDLFFEPTEKSPSAHFSFSHPPHPSPIPGETYPSLPSPPSSYPTRPTPHSFYLSNNNLEAYIDTSPEPGYSSTYPEQPGEDTKPLRESTRSSRSSSNTEKSFESSQPIVPALYPTSVPYIHINSDPQYDERFNSPFQRTPSSISGPTLSPYNQPNQGSDINTLNQLAGINPAPSPHSYASPTYASYPRSIPESLNPISVYPASNPNPYPSPAPTPYTDSTADTYSSSEKHLLNSKPYSRSYTKLSGDKSFTNPGKSNLIRNLKWGGGQWFLT